MRINTPDSLIVGELIFWYDFIKLWLFHKKKRRNSSKRLHESAGKMRFFGLDNADITNWSLTLCIPIYCISHFDQIASNRPFSEIQNIGAFSFSRRLIGCMLILFNSCSSRHSCLLSSSWLSFQSLLWWLLLPLFSYTQTNIRRPIHECWVIWRFIQKLDKNSKDRVDCTINIHEGVTFLHFETTTVTLIQV